MQCQYEVQVEGVKIPTKSAYLECLNQHVTVNISVFSTTPQVLWTADKLFDFPQFSPQCERVKVCTDTGGGGWQYDITRRS